MRLGAAQRLAAALALGILGYVVLPDAISWHTRLVVSWDAGTLAYLLFAWIIIATADATETRAHALAQDISGYIIFLVVLGAACASIVAIGFVVGTLRGLEVGPKSWHLGITVAALTLSWLLIQTVYVFHYAHAYYRHEDGDSPQPALKFPGNREPDYGDFAYYSFVIGMTSQVSDVQVIAPRLRTMTLQHAVLAFIFNIAVLALSINTIASAV